MNQDEKCVCELCGKIFLDLSFYATHLENAHDASLLLCGHCLIPFPSSGRERHNPDCPYQAELKARLAAQAHAKAVAKQARKNRCRCMECRKYQNYYIGYRVQGGLPSLNKRRR